MAKKEDNKKKQPLTTKPEKKGKAQSTQKHLQIAEIREDTVIMKDGTLRAVILVSSINKSSLSFCVSKPFSVSLFTILSRFSCIVLAGKP